MKNGQSLANGKKHDHITKAKKEDYRSRASYKIKQLDKNSNLLKKEIPL